VRSSEEAGAAAATALRADELFAAGDHAGTVALLESAKVRELDPGTSGLSPALLLWRLARAHWKMATACKQAKDSAGRSTAADRAREAARRALEAAKGGAMPHMWFAICNEEAASAEGSIRGKVDAGHAFKEHASRALEILNDAPAGDGDGNKVVPGEVGVGVVDTRANLLHMLGRWAYEVASISWWERRAAEAVVGPLPTADFEDAVELLQKAEAASEGEDPAKSSTQHENLLWLGKALLKAEKAQEALESFQRLAALPAATAVQRQFQQRGRKYMT
jgi:tetratricopeptide (TPR) repeat protein